MNYTVTVPEGAVLFEAYVLKGNDIISKQRIASPTSEVTVDVPKNPGTYFLSMSVMFNDDWGQFLPYQIITVEGAERGVHSIPDEYRLSH